MNDVINWAFDVNQKLQVALRVKADGDTNSGQSDEAFLSKGSSQEELDENKLKNSLEFEDSEEYEMILA